MGDAKTLKRRRSEEDENAQLRQRITELEAQLKEMEKNGEEKKEKDIKNEPPKEFHKHVHVLLMQWGEEDLGVGPEVWELSNTFKDCYGFNVEDFIIPDYDEEEFEEVEPQMVEGVKDWIEAHQAPDTLLIFYYAGHGKRSDASKELMLMELNEGICAEFSGTKVVRLFEDATCDSLLFLDCCESAVSSRESGTIVQDGTITDVISAAGFDGETAGPGVGTSFSFALNRELRLRSRYRVEFSVRDLYNWTLHRLSCRLGTGTPIYTNLTGDGARQIYFRRFVDDNEGK